MRWTETSTNVTSDTQSKSSAHVPERSHCVRLVREPLSEDRAISIATMLKALADPVRLRLMSLVLSHEGGEACVCD